LGGTGRSHVPYEIKAQKIGTVQTENRGRVTYQVNAMPQHCPLIKMAAGRLSGNRVFDSK